MALAGCRRMIEEVLYATKQRQLAPYCGADVGAALLEIEQRKQAIQQILDRQQSDVKFLVDNDFDTDGDGQEILNFPHVIIWVHVAAIQQLHRALTIYRYERHKLVVRYSL
eukprot:CAMPEP_0113852608 /NCGR_PEP_ID=MMETSP0372-20130328/5651_1 /TAXON_ID=340204 /ORGANISM="Lankesteria abbotti" /LENGTH=110 /DNA_ID=CAMNT_0000824269 /DNA_START=104 /DNA_END=432 /DNA_ORIENTATION=+ /assembly_acc=CAM_ASM_000359